MGYLDGADGVEQVFDLFLGGGGRQAVYGHRAGLRLRDPDTLPALRRHSTPTSATTTPSTRDHHLHSDTHKLNRLKTRRTSEFLRAQFFCWTYPVTLVHVDLLLLRGLLWSSCCHCDLPGGTQSLLRSGSTNRLLRLILDGRSFLSL